MSRPDLQTMCDSLEFRLPGMLAQHPESADFWRQFSDSAMEIEKQAIDEEDEAYIASRIDGMLAANGLHRVSRQAHKR